MPKIKFNKHLQTRIASQLEKYHEWVRNEELRNVRNKETHEDFWLAFAVSVCQAAKQGVAKYEKLKTRYAAAFEYTYDMTWEEAAAQAKAAVRV